MGWDGGVIWTLNALPARRCIQCNCFFAFTFSTFSPWPQQRCLIFCAVSVNASAPLLILRCWKLDTVFCHLPSSPSRHQFVMTLHAGLVRAHILPLPPGSRFNPGVLVRLSSPACERICCHPPIPAIIFWRFSASQWKTECVWKLKEICVKLPDWQLWQTGSISFHAIYTSYLFLSALNVVTYKKILPLNLHLNKSV